MEFLSILYMIVVFVQCLLSYGTAYRYTKKGGDNGIALFGWMFAFVFASYVPGLGFYFWHKSKQYS